MVRKTGIDRIADRVGLIIEKWSAIRVASSCNITKSIKPPIRPTRASQEQVSHVCQPRVGIFEQELPTNIYNTHYMCILFMYFNVTKRTCVVCKCVSVYKAHWLFILTPSLLHFDTRFWSQPPSLFFYLNTRVRSFLGIIFHRSVDESVVTFAKNNNE